MKMASFIINKFQCVCVYYTKLQQLHVSDHDNFDIDLVFITEATAFINGVISLPFEIKYIYIQLYKDIL